MFYFCSDHNRKSFHFQAITPLVEEVRILSPYLYCKTSTSKSSTCKILFKPAITDSPLCLAELWMRLIGTADERPAATLRWVHRRNVTQLSGSQDETAYREEVENLILWCQDNCLSLNVSKTNGDLLWSVHTNILVKKAQQRLYHLRQLQHC